MHFKPLAICFALLSFSCHNLANNKTIKKNPVKADSNIIGSENPYAHINEIPLPDGYKRINVAPGSFGEWLRNFELKKDRTVYLFNGEAKFNQTAQYAVLNIDVGNKDLQQCADAVMRLRADWQFAMQKFDSITFTDNEHGVYHFTAPYNRSNFNTYLSRVFGMCGSASLSKQLHAVDDLSTIMPGDVLIRGGFPGHAVIVMDVATNDAGERIYMLAQSYMPAQDIHVLNNPLYASLSPWFQVNDHKLIQTPEYTFYRTELKRW
ncbi:MAG TPA: DUF4846 domain-containing protein [Ferruginibacter sp.]|nr:DUF4846 domain-containing protein [Ferruginibacter sp.]